MRYFAPTASWNRTADELGIDRSALVADWPQRLMAYGGGLTKEGQRFDLKFRDYSVPMYDAAKATTTARCYQLNWAAKEMTFGNVPVGQAIPWNPAWQPGGGADRMMVIVNRSTGEAFYLWGVVPNPGLACWDWWGPNNQAGFSSPWGVKVGVGTLHRQASIFTADDRTKVSSRGAGFDKAACLLRASEVASGEVRHALELTICNPGYPPMTLRRPAGKLEYQSAAQVESKVGYVFPLDQTLPSGARFRVKKTRAQVEAWAMGRWPDKPGLRWSMIVIGWALCVYGFIVSESGAWGVGMETDSMVDPVAAAEWRALGMVDDGSANPMWGGGGLLAGLFTAADLEVVLEPAA